MLREFPENKDVPRLRSRTLPEQYARVPSFPVMTTGIATTPGQFLTLLRTLPRRGFSGVDKKTFP